MHLQTDLFPTSTLTRQRPIQCEGVSRGPERMSEVAVSGSVNPQFDWGGLLGNVAKTAIPLIAGAL